MWKNIIGQVKVKEKLKSIYKSNKISHAYLFHGMEGVGKDAAAIEFAKLLNCQNKSNSEACDECEECKNISGLKSEHFNIICALPAGKSEQTDSDPLEKLSAEDFENYLEQVKLKSENPYKRINIPNANNIRINSIRELINKIYLSTGIKHKKVFLISEADKMTLEASNALLKILEEPPRKSVIILTTSKPNTLLPTVIGRCHQIHFEKLPEPLIQEKLFKEFDKTQLTEGQSTKYDELEIKLASKLSMGSYSRASALLEMDIKEIRDTAINYLISIIKNDYAEMVSAIKNITSKNNKEKTKYFLFYLNVWFRDLLEIKYVQDSASDSKTKIANFDIKDRLVKFLKNYPNVDIFNIILAIEEAEQSINQNVQLQLIILNLSFKMKSLLK